MARATSNKAAVSVRGRGRGRGRGSGGSHGIARQRGVGTTRAQSRGRSEAKLARDVRRTLDQCVGDFSGDEPDLARAHDRRTRGTVHHTDGAPISERDTPKASEPEPPQVERPDTVHETGRSYFDAHRDAAVRTSSETLANIRLPSADVLANAMSRIGGHIPRDISARILGTKTKLAALEKYAYLLACGHSLLFYGFGSKIKLLEAVAQGLAADAGDDGAVFLAQGYNPSLSVRSVLSRIADAVVPRTTAFPKRHLLDFVRAIREALGATTLEKRVILVVHNIDGTGLRSLESQNALAELATVPGLSVVASIDHINAPLLWDGSSIMRFRWAWIPATTFEPYAIETACCSRPLLLAGEERRIEGAVVLLNSLSVNARKAFRLLAQKQIEGTTNEQPDRDCKDGGKSNADISSRTLKQSSGKVATSASRTTFNDFFTQCRDRFLVSDPANLRTILTELETHSLLDRRKAVDVAEQLWIPLSDSQLQTVLETIQD